MSLSLIKKNSSSPFHIQRSMVDQGGEGGAYESGGFDPNTVYNDNATSGAVIGIGKTIGASLLSRTSEDINESDIDRKSKLEDRKKNLESKKANSKSDKDTGKYNRRIERVEGRIENKTKSIEEYNKKKKPTLTSDIIDIVPKK